jgi:hypothetical protein
MPSLKQYQSIKFAALTMRLNYDWLSVLTRRNLLVRMQAAQKDFAPNGRG